MDLIELVFKGKSDQLRLALEEPSTDVDAVDGDNRTALFHSIIDGRKEMALILLKGGADPNLLDNHHCAPLHYASAGFETDLAKLLLENGANIDPQDDDGNTPLSNAVFNSDGHGELITLLLTSGADRNLKNAYEVSPKDLAESIGSFDVLKFM